MSTAEEFFADLGLEMPEGTIFEKTASGYNLRFPDNISPEFEFTVAAAILARDEKRRAEIERLNAEAQCGSKSTT